MIGRGSRVRLSAEYGEQFPRRRVDQRERAGTVVGMSRDGSAARVWWDGTSRNSVQGFALPFLSEVDQDGRRSDLEPGRLEDWILGQGG